LHSFSTRRSSDLFHSFSYFFCFFCRLDSLFNIFKRCQAFHPFPNRSESQGGEELQSASVFLTNYLDSLGKNVCLNDSTASSISSTSGNWPVSRIDLRSSLRFSSNHA